MWKPIKSGILSCLTLVILICSTLACTSCTERKLGSVELAKNVYIELIDWHISGLWIFNCPVVWVRVANYNNVPVKEVCIRFRTFGFDGKVLSEGTYTMEGTVGPASVKNFMEQTVGVVDLESDMLSVELVSVESED
ncbi:MAG: hypothetical protein K2Z81_10620 [Cyanobacteria bacterium]|nr:hypothetical protein [Cyanobacteriota bacterium]